MFRSGTVCMTLDNTFKQCTPFFNIPADNTKRKVEYAKQSSSSDFGGLNVHHCCIKQKCKYFFFLKYMNR